MMVFVHTPGYYAEPDAKEGRRGMRLVCTRRCHPVVRNQTTREVGFDLNKLMRGLLQHNSVT